jgi:hypothetical protein
MAMRFRNFGGIYQFMINDEDDLAQIDALDPARWAATSAPLHDLHCDPAFLAYIDAEATGRVRVGQIVAARDWLFARLARRSVVKGRLEAIPVEAIQSSGAGEPPRAAALRVNREQKAADATRIALADVRALKASFPTILANGDGVVPPAVVPEPEVAAFIQDVIATVGSVKDRGGVDGVDGALLDAFRAKGQAWLDWRAKAREAAVWGDDTAAAAELVARLDAKIEAYFLHADLVRQEAPAAGLQKLTEEAFRALSARDAEAIEGYLRGSPLATPDPRGVLALDAVGALYRDDVGALRDKVLPRALGVPVRELTRDTWRKAKAVFDGYAAWAAAKPAEPFDALGEEKLKVYLAGPLPARVTHYLELDKAAAPEVAQVDELEKLLLYVRWLVELVNNFVNFSAIYLPQETSLVETGSLVIDGRRLEFCAKVLDRAAHKAVATESLIFLVYARISEKQGGASFEVVAPVTGGEKGRLRVGKRGIFIDTKGVEWDSQIVEVVENPISVREAMFAPFRRASKFVNDKIEAYFGSASDAQQAGLQTSTAAATEQAQQGAEAAAARAAAATPEAARAAGTPREGLNVNTLILGGGIALAGIGAVLASLFGALKTSAGWAILAALVAAVLALSALNAWLKLRKRDMSVLLEANGWAVNVNTRISRRIAKVFAFTPELPKGATLDTADMLPESKDEEGSGGTLLLLVALAALVALGWYGHFKAHWF